MKRSFKSTFPYLYIATGFFVLVLAGSVLLVLPISTKQSISYIDALFLSVSSVCITGLSPVVVTSTFTTFGKGVILALIQLGGLGFTTVAVSVLAILGVRLGISEKFLVEETLGSGKKLNYRLFLRRAVLITLVAETTGFILNLIALSGTYTGWRLVGTSLFHSVSAFNNAGIDVFGDGSMVPVKTNGLLMFTTAMLTIVGGLGFLVINDVISTRRMRLYSVHTKIVLSITPILILGGGLGLYFSEWGKIAFQDALFLSVMSRTCGFTVCDLSEWNNASLLFLNFLMLTGGAPASTAGGVKCTTLFVLIVATVSFVRGKPMNVFHREIKMQTAFRAFLITLFFLLIIFCTGTIVCALEPEIPLAYVFTETVSAMANVGLSAGITAQLSVVSKLLLCLCMFIGRIGCMTLFMLFKKNNYTGRDRSVRFPEAEVIIG